MLLLASCLQENGDFAPDAGIAPRAVAELFRLLDERNAQVTFEVGAVLSLIDCGLFSKFLLSMCRLKFKCFNCIGMVWKIC